MSQSILTSLVWLQDSLTENSNWSWQVLIDCKKICLDFSLIILIWSENYFGLKIKTNKIYQEQNVRSRPKTMSLAVDQDQLRPTEINSVPGNY